MKKISMPIVWSAIILAVSVIIFLSTGTMIFLEMHRYSPRIVVLRDPDFSNSYVTDGNYVYYDNAIISGVTPDSFKILTRGYAVGAKQVYYYGTAIAGADASSFQVLGSEGYAKDDKSVYFEGQKIEADVKSFFVFSSPSDSITSDYAKDKFGIFYLGALIQGADNNTFTVLGNGYAKDANNVYYTDQIIPGADTTTFVVALNPDQNCDTPGHSACYDAQDKNSKFYGGVIAGVQ